MPTYFGPTNIPPLEAFATGCPVAVSGIYGMPDQMRGAAVLFDPRSISDMARVLRRLWDDDVLCDELANRGAKLDKEWGADAYAGRLRQILEQICGP